MPFDKFQARREETVRRGLIGLIMVPLFMVGFFTFNHLAPQLGFQERNGQLHHSPPTYSEQKSRVEELCAGLPRPEMFQLTDSTPPEHYADSTLVTYRYRSIRGAAEIMPTFLVWFNENGWYHIPDTSTFEKGKQKIFISPWSNHQFTHYDIYCSEKD